MMRRPARSTERRSRGAPRPSTNQPRLPTVCGPVDPHRQDSRLRPAFLLAVYTLFLLLPGFHLASHRSTGPAGIAPAETVCKAACGDDCRDPSHDHRDHDHGRCGLCQQLGAHHPWVDAARPWRPTTSPQPVTHWTTPLAVTATQRRSPPSRAPPSRA